MKNHEIVVYGSQERLTTNVLVDRPVQCPLCGAMTAFFKNVRGTSYCYRCAPEPENSLL